MPYKNEKRLPSVIPASMDWLEDNGNTRAPRIEHRLANRLVDMPPPPIAGVRSAIYTLEKEGKSHHSELGTLLPYVVKWCEDSNKDFIVVATYRGARLLGTTVALSSMFAPEVEGAA